mgnify:CR=1 FL=1
MLIPSFIRFLTALCLISGTATALHAESSFKFNLFEFEGAYVQRVFNFDEAYTSKYGIPVPTPFSISVPIRSDVKMIADGKPDDGGFAKFTFAVEDQGNLILLENIKIVKATVPIPTDAENPEAVRIQIAAKLLQEQAFPSAVKGFQSPEILALEKYEFDNSRGVQLIGRYVDPSIGPMLLRLTINLNPDHPVSYLTVANMNLSLVPVSNGDTLRQTITARVANGLKYK